MPFCSNSIGKLSFAKFCQQQAPLSLRIFATEPSQTGKQCRQTTKHRRASKHSPRELKQADKLIARGLWQPSRTVVVQDARRPKFTNRGRPLSLLFQGQRQLQRELDKYIYNLRHFGADDVLSLRLPLLIPGRRGDDAEAKYLFVNREGGLSLEVCFTD